jgi:hypothetical protein
MSKIQVLKSSHVAGTSAKGSYSFYRNACIFIDDAGLPEAVGDIVTEEHIAPGVYPASFSVSSFQGKLTAKILPVIAAPSAAKP